MAKHQNCFYVTLFFIFFISTVITANTSCSKVDQDSLLSSFNRPFPSLNWSSNDCCSWEGITCDGAGRVGQLILPSKGIQGGIPRSLGGLTKLSHLNLSHNSLSGSLKAKLFLSLNQLEILDLSYNLLSGELPLSLPFNSIRVVNLSNNRFKGTISSSFLHHAWNLTTLNVSYNHLTGQIPFSICLHSPSVTLLDYSSNEFSGTIPPGLQNCSKLEVLHAGFNKLSGLLPSDIYNVLTLQEISLPSNKLSGSINDRIANLTNLTVLELYFNKLTGLLPPNVGKLSKLKLLVLHFNNLEGSLPPSLMNCTKLTELILGFNQLGGDISELSFSKLTQLRKLDLIQNHFTGTLPISLYSCKFLKALRLGLNNLEGQVQPEIQSLKHLAFLSLSASRLTNVTGTLHILMESKSLEVLILSENFLGEEMADGHRMIDSAFQNLRTLSLSKCQFTGSIPQWLSKLKKLALLDMSDNNFTGSIPGWLGTLPNLFVINLSNNSLSGEFPKELCTLKALVSPQKAAVQIGHDYFELPIYSQRTNVSEYALQYKYIYNFPRSIYFSNNSLTGSIPIEIGQLQLLQNMDLSLNNFVGSIPDQISNLAKLEILYLSRNQLSGEIPASLSSLHFLSSFTVAYNNLQGQIPSSTQLQSFGANAFEGNLGLCGAPLPNECQQTNASDNDNESEDVQDGSGTPWLHISVGLGFFTGFWGVCGPLVLSRSWRNVYFQFLYKLKDKLNKW